MDLFLIQPSLLILPVVFTAIGVVWWPAAGATVALLGVGAVAAYQHVFKTGTSTLADLAHLDGLIGDGRPLLLVIYSDT